MSEKWKINQFSTHREPSIEDESSRVTICNVSLNGTRGSEEELNRRANLIAAAPEMLALLKTSRRNLSSIIAACNCNTYDPWLAEMDRVIALAEGGEG